MARRSKKSHDILGEIIAVALFAMCSAVFYIIKIIFTGIFEYFKELGKILKEYKDHQDYVAKNLLEEEEEERLARELLEQHEKAVDNLRYLLAHTENKLYYHVVKTEFPGEGRIREYVNFITYNRDTVALENANTLINTVFNNVLCIYKGKSKKLQDTIVLEDYACDKKDIARNLADKLGIDKVEMLMA